MTSTVQVAHSNKNPTHDFSLSDGRKTYGFRYRDSSPDKSMVDISQTPSTLKLTAGGSKFGDWDPSQSHIEQRTWVGGRGLDDFSEDPSRFSDSMNAWTVTDSWLHPAPKWKFARGLVSDICNLPGDISWVGIFDDDVNVSIPFSFASDTTIDRVYFWLRKVGSPADLSVSLYSDDGGGNPDAEIVAVTVDIDTINDTISVFHGFILGDQTASAGVTYHIVVKGDALDTGTNHWEIASDSDGATSKKSADLVTWTSAAYTLYHRILKLGVQRKFHPFKLLGAWYVVDERDDQSASKIYLNGWRGKATSATSTTLTNTNASMVVDQAAGAVLRIISGVGKGLSRKIISNTADTFTFEALEKTPDNTSVYVVEGSDWWFELSGTGITGVVTSVCVYNNIAVFAQGSAINMRKMRYDPTAAPPAHGYADDGTNKADLLYTFYDATDNVVVYKALNSDVKEKSAPAVAWGSALVFANEKPVGDSTYQINRFGDYDEVLWALKEDSVWRKTGGVWRKLNVGLDALPSTNNGLAMAAQNMYFYFSWALSVERLYGGSTASSGTLDDIGPWKGSGLPENRRGVVSALLPIISWLFAGIDAGRERISSLLVYNGRGYHEAFRAWETGRRVRNVFWVPVPESNPFLWISVGEDLVYQKYPKDSLNLLYDSSMEFQHEAVVVSSMIDMGAARIPKFFKELSLLTDNTRGDLYIGFDFQVDDKIGSSVWQSAGAFLTSPESSLSIRQGDRRTISYRLRMRADDPTNPPKIRATVIEGFARTPEKRQWNFTVNASAYGVDKRGNLQVSPSEVYGWLQEKNRRAKVLRLRSTIKELDATDVVIDNIVPVRKTLDTLTGEWSGYIQMTLREA